MSHPRPPHSPYAALQRALSPNASLRTPCRTPSSESVRGLWWAWARTDQSPPNPTYLDRSHGLRPRSQPIAIQVQAPIHQLRELRQRVQRIPIIQGSGTAPPSTSSSSHRIVRLIRCRQITTGSHVHASSKPPHAPPSSLSRALLVDLPNSRFLHKFRFSATWIDPMDLGSEAADSHAGPASHPP